MITVNDFYKTKFNSKTYKLSLDAGCTCPTRDGTLGTGGCIFCSAAGSGDFTPKEGSTVSISKQIEMAKQIVAPKLKNQDVKYIAYFQSFTNTYGDFERLKGMWEEALMCRGIVGIAIATRPDCLSQNFLDYFKTLADRTYLQIELGFQTANEKTAQYIRRGFSNKIYYEAVEKLHQTNPKIHVVTHVMFGLPEESTIDMMNSVKQAVNAKTDGIKITSLYILKETDIAYDFLVGKFKALEMDEYFELVKSALQIIPENVIIHRITGDPPKSMLIAPQWAADKKRVLNSLNKILEK